MIFDFVSETPTQCLSRYFLGIPYNPNIRQPPVNGEPVIIPALRPGRFRRLDYRIVHDPQPSPGTIIVNVGFGRAHGTTQLRP